MMRPALLRPGTPGGLLLGALLCAWQLAAHGLPPSQLPAPTDVARALADPHLLGALGPALLATLARTLLGFALGACCGFALGFASGASALFRRTTGPLVEGLRPLPSVALIPLGILFFGMGNGLNLAITAFACAWPVHVSAQDGVAGVNPVLRDTARILGCSRSETLLRVVLPASLPAALTGLRVGLGIALAVEVSVEMLVPRQGIGALAMNAALAGQGARLYAAMAAAGLAGFALNHLFVALENRLLRHYGQKERTA